MMINQVIEKFRGSHNCERSRDYPSPTVGGIDYATGELLYALVRHSKPEVCVETGCDEGISTIYIAQALKDNGKGMLYTCDIEPQLIYDAGEHIKEAKLTKYVQLHLCKGIDLIGKYMKEECMKIGGINFAFLDSMNSHPYENVKAEYDLLYPLLKSNSLVVLHDAISHIGPRQLYEEIGDMNKLLLPFSDGLAIMRKR